MQIKLQGNRPAVSVRLGVSKPLGIQTGVPTGIGIGKKIYDGKYEATPRTYEPVVLGTADRIMERDVTVERIPQFTVSNEAGGQTLILGEEYFEHGN